MVTFNNVGRLGNFLFQCSTALSYALKHNLEFTIPRSNGFWPVYFEHLRNPRYKAGLPKVELHERGHAYQEIPFEERWRHINIVLHGFFQSELYFKDYRKEILKAFIPDELNDWPSWEIDKNKKVLYRLKTIPNTVAVHVRRGDYLHPAQLDKHPVCPLKYYNLALNEFPSTSKFIVFSDDIEWCKGVFKGDEYTFNTTADPLKAMYEMASCSDFIIANSSFSWWAAWIGGYHSKVVSPSKDNWFGPGNKSLCTKDIIPETWIQITY